MIVGCFLKGENRSSFESSLEELRALTEAARGTVEFVRYQERDQIHPSTYIGKGKIAEIAEEAEANELDLLVFNDELSPGQVQSIQSQTKLPVIDRTQVILDIFASRARTKEGKIQVELAQLNYMLPRLIGQGEALSRLGGGIGTRGPGETKLETDRRHIHRRMTELKKQLEDVKKRRTIYHDERQKQNLAQFALVGYTNAGKSTLLNQLTEADSHAEDQLFATLDPLTRSVQLPSGYQALLSDTVGFIQDLPTTLVAAFRATLDELTYANVLIHVVDATDERMDEHMKTVEKLLTELQVDHLPTLTVLNKTDQLTDEQAAPFLPREHVLAVSAYDQQDVVRLKEEMERLVKEEMIYYHVQLPAEEGKLYYRLRNETLVEDFEFNEEREVYDVKGYVYSDHALWGQIQQYMQA
nr:GTPase HflX [Salsuginibacillus kocurii]